VPQSGGSDNNWFDNFLLWRGLAAGMADLPSKLRSSSYGDSAGSRRIARIGANVAGRFAVRPVPAMTNLPRQEF